MGQDLSYQFYGLDTFLDLCPGMQIELNGIVYTSTNRPDRVIEVDVRPSAIYITPLNAERITIALPVATGGDEVWSLGGTCTTPILDRLVGEARKYAGWPLLYWVFVFFLVAVVILIIWYMIRQERWGVYILTPLYALKGKIVTYL